MTRWLYHGLMMCTALAMLSSPQSRAGSIDTLKKDSGTPTSTPAIADGWEESVIIPLSEPCIVRKVLIYYASGTGTDVVHITGDASEGTIPPSQYCLPYNTLAEADVKVSGKGWVEIDMSRHNVTFDGVDRIVVQHIVRAGGPQWAQDNNGQSPITSFQYDPVTPNPNFFNIPGIYYQARGDYMVRLVVERPFDGRPAPTMIDVTAAMGLTTADRKPLGSDQASIVDWDGDGYDDVALPGSFFRNDSGRALQRVQLPIGGGPTVWGDVDNDGDVDVFVLMGFGNDQLWRNDGNGKLVNVTKESGLVNNAPCVTALWFDMEHDGDLDLFLANGRSESNGNEVYFQDKLWRNDGNMTFTDVTAPSKIALGEPAPFYDTWGASLCDFNNDGLTDIFVATYRLAPDRLYRNNGDGTFTEVSSSTGAIGIPTTQPQYFGHGMGSEWGDVNADGLVDLLVGNLGHPDSRAQYSNPSLVLRNVGTAAAPSFRNWYDLGPDGVLKWHGVKFKEMNAGMCLADLDQDGSQDLWHGQISYQALGAGANRPAHLYLGSTEPDLPFRDITWASGMFVHGAWTAVRTDIDRDGDVDLVCASGTESVKVFRNDLPKQGASITIRLRDTRQGRHAAAYGARVVVAAGGQRFHRWLPGSISGGRMAQMTQDLHVGIGAAAAVDSVTVYWPGGAVTRHTGLRPHTYVELSADGKSRQILGLRAANLRPANGAVGVAATDMFVWSADASGPVRLEITPQSTPAQPKIVRDNIVGTQAKIDLPPGLYRWKIITSSGESTPWSVYIGDPMPSLPKVVEPASGTSTLPITTTIRWTRSTYDVGGSFATTYHVRLWNVSTKTPVLALDTMITDSALVLTSLPAATKFSGGIRAIYRSASTSDSALISFTTYDVPPSPLAVFPADGAANVTTRPRFQWTRPAWVDKGYEIEVDTLPNFSTSTIRKASDTSLAWTPPLRSGKVYHWRSRGFNLVGAGAWSPTAIFTTTGTTHVSDDETLLCNGRVELYDVRGRLLSVSLANDLPRQLADVSGVVLVVHRTAEGTICQTRVHVR
ncbi:MAG: CRTAC1 family protein [Candidatus Kapabacteria bacterium]|nr:CRTAC1 family protein [Candidatus Kapabacteria bacterium]